MSPYASELATARLDALRTLIDALNEADSPEEKRRCAVAIFNAPDPCDLDDEIELEDDDDSDESNEGDEIDDSDRPENSDDLESDTNDDEDDSDDEDDHPDDMDETDAVAAPAQTSPSMSPTVTGPRHRQCDIATPEPPNPKEPLE